MYGLIEAQPYALTMQQDLIREVTAAAPEFVVEVDAYGSWIPHEGAPNRIFTWWSGYWLRSPVRGQWKSGYRLAGRHQRGSDCAMVRLRGRNRRVQGRRAPGSIVLSPRLAFLKYPQARWAAPIPRASRSPSLKVHDLSMPPTGPGITE